MNEATLNLLRLSLIDLRKTGELTQVIYCDGVLAGLILSEQITPFQFYMANTLVSNAYNYARGEKK